jgi:hypothetical protein
VRAAALGALAVVLLVGTAGCGEDADPAPPGAGAAGLLARRSQAVLDRDEEAFLATAAPERRPADERLWDGLSSIPLSVYEIVVREGEGDVGEREGDPGKGAVAADVRAVAAEVRWQLAGFRGPPALDRVRYELRRVDGRWLVAGVAGDGALWDDGALTVTAGERVTVVAAGERPDLLAAAEAAAGAVADAIGADAGGAVPAPDRVLALVPRDDGELRRLLGGALGGDVSAFTAFTVAGTGPTPPVGEGQPRVVVRDGAPPAPDTLVHELVHAAAYPVAARAPVWLHEGLAEWVAHGRGARRAVAGTDGRLPTDAELAGPEPQVSYGEAESAVAFLAAARGADAPWRLLARIGAGAGEDEALREVWGGDRAAFETAWAAEVPH